MAIFFLLGFFLIVVVLAGALILSGWVWTGVAILVLMVLLILVAAWDATL
jgi:hypothetical protein